MNAILLALTMTSTPVNENSMYDFTLKDIDGKALPLKKYEGKVALVVNVASRCGNTPQYEGLQKLYTKYKDRGLKVAGFPSDDFRREAADEAKTAEVCFENFGVTFDMFAPIAVTGDKAHPLFREIARQSSAPEWNFHKYVIDRNGRVVATFPSRVKPDAPEVLAAIEKVL